MSTERVLMVLGPSTGGIRRHVAALAAGLRARGWAVVVAGPAGVLDGLEPADAPAVERLDVPAGLDPRALVRARRQLAALVAVHQPSLVHAHGLKAGWVAARVRPGQPGPPPVVVTVHNLVLPELTPGPGGRVLRVLEGALPRRVDATIAVSPGIAARFAGRGAGRLHVVAPVGPEPVPTRAPVEVRAAWGVAPDAPLVVSVARLHPQKGLDTLLAAVPALAARVPAVQVVVVGEGPLEAVLRAAVAGRALGGQVRLVGPMAVGADALGAADVVAVTSVWESGPLVAAEALELARPLVSTPVGFVPDLVEDATSGRLVPVGDAEALAAALADVLADPAGAAALGRAGQARVRATHGSAVLVDRVEAVYRGMLSGS